MRTWKFRELPRSEQWMLIVSWTIKIILALLLTTMLWRRWWLWAFGTALIIIVSLLPAMLERSTKRMLPLEVDLATALFLLLTFVLGEVHNFYERIIWWDVLMHFLSGLLLALLGFYLAFTLYFTPKVRLHIDPFFVAVFAFSFALSLGALWEIFEFIMDSTLGFSMQLASLNDTMWDLIVDAISAAMMAGLTYIYVVKPRQRLIKRLFERLDRR